MASKQERIQLLKAALEDLEVAYKSTYTTPEAIQALQKTLHSFNITITDWNVLINYIYHAGLSVDTILLKTIPELIDIIVLPEGYVDLTSNQVIEGTKTFRSIKVPYPKEYDDASNKEYVDDKTVSLTYNETMNILDPKEN